MWGRAREQSACARVYGARIAPQSSTECPSKGGSVMLGICEASLVLAKVFFSSSVRKSQL